MSGAPEFDWTDDDPIAVPGQAAIAVYFNPMGNVVIRQEHPYPDDDVWIVVNPRDVPALCRHLVALVGCETTEVDAPTEEVTTGKKPRPMTAAERKRKQRQLERDHRCDIGVTERDTLRDIRDEEGSDLRPFAAE